MRIFLTLLFLALLPLPAIAQEAGAGPTGTISTASDPATDAQIANRIRQILGELGSFPGITVQVSEGIVTFRGTADSASAASELTVLATRVEGVVAVKNEVVETTDLARRLSPAMQRFQNRLHMAWTSLPLLLVAASAFALINFAGHLLSRWRMPWEKLAPNSFIADLYQQLIRIIFLLSATVVALDIIDASRLLGTILGAAGIVGLAVGFAVRDTVENYIASILLSIRQPFRPNDAVEINGDQGKVIRLTSRATILLSWDGNHIRIPNATVFKSRIVNFSQNAERRFSFTLNIAMDSDLMRAVTLAGETVQALPFTLDSPVSEAWLGDTNAAGVEITVVGWIEQNKTSIVKARGEAMRRVILAFNAAGIEMPDAAYRLKLDNIPAAAPPPPARPAKGPKPRATTDGAATVDAVNESQLERIIAAERDSDEAEDLLTPAAKHE